MCSKGLGHDTSDSCISTRGIRLCFRVCDSGSVKPAHCWFKKCLQFISTCYLLSLLLRINSDPFSIMLGITVIIALTLYNQVAWSRGVFEVRLVSFSNPGSRVREGQCCQGPGDGGCVAPCSTRFRICLKQFQTKLDATSPCTFGQYITPVLGNDTISLSPDGPPLNGFQNPVQLPFDFTWPGSFSLIVEAWHDRGNSSSRLSDDKELIQRGMVQRYLDAGTPWTPSEDGPLAFEYRVRCDDQYYGSGCALICRPRDDGFGHYTCSDSGKRVCLDGWEGDYCNIPKCLPGCDPQHGHCTKPNECQCHSGWKGRFCTECERYPGCLHGSCKKPWDCLCDEGWGGLFCNQDLNYCTNHKPCQNGGTCFNTGQGSYTCSCPPGYTGTDCQTKINGCGHSPCRNGATCRDLGAKGYRCECARHWIGTHCEVSGLTCGDLPCQNGATCEDGPTGYKCQCAPGFTGTDCESEVDYCANRPCLNGGTCSADQHGFTCACPVGFIGSQCQIDVDDCLPNPCANGGTCIDGVNKFRCQCVPGYVGQFCQNEVDYCLAKPCANGGLCSNLINDYRCACKPGFTGKDCSQEINECLSNPCKNGGTCIDRVNGYKCECPTGYAGTTCSGDTNNDDAGGQSRRVAQGRAEAPLSSGHVVVLAALSVAIPAGVCVAAIVVVCLKQRRAAERRKADDEARRQNERNMSRSDSTSHMIKNTWTTGKCVEEGGADWDPAPVYSLQRTKSQKQLNTDVSRQRQSAYCKDPPDNIGRQVDKRLSLLSIDSSLCSSDAGSGKGRHIDRDQYLKSHPSSVYVIEEPAGGPYLAPPRPRPPL